MTTAAPAHQLVVVGGGLAGITAALVAADAGAQVTLLEARPRLGGATFSFQRDGLWLDNGQHVFLRCCTAYRWLLRRLGATDLVTLQPRLALPVVAPGGRIGWLRRGALPLPAPLHLAGALARYPYLSWPQRMRVGRAALAMRRLDPADEANDRQALAPWLAAHGQDPGSVKALWELISLPTLNALAADSSLALALKVFKTGLLEVADAADIGYARVPLQQLHGDRAERALASAGAQFRPRSRVASIEPMPEPEGGLAVTTGEGVRLEAAAVILAVPHDGVAGLLPEAAGPERLGALGRLGSAPIVNLHVHYDRRVTTLDFAAGLGTPVQWVFDRTAASGLDPTWRDGQHLAVSLSAADAEIDTPTAALRERYLPALAQLFVAAAEARVVSFLVTRERTATFRQAPGTAALRPAARTVVPGLYLAGAWTATGWPATMESAVRSGLVAAREALATFGLSPRADSEQFLTHEEVVAA